MVLLGIAGTAGHGGGFGYLVIVHHVVRKIFAFHSVAFFLVALCRIQTGEEDAVLAEFTGISDDVFQNPLL